MYQVRVILRSLAESIVQRSGLVRTYLVLVSYKNSPFIDPYSVPDTVMCFMDYATKSLQKFWEMHMKAHIEGQ